MGRISAEGKGGGAEGETERHGASASASDEGAVDAVEGRLSALPLASGLLRHTSRSTRRPWAAPWLRFAKCPRGAGSRARGRTRCEVWPCSLSLGRVSRGAMLKRGAAVLCLSLLQLFQTSPRGEAFTSFHLFTSRMKVLEIRSSFWIFGSLHRSNGIPRRSRPDWGPRGWGSAPRGERPLSARAGRRRASGAQSERLARYAGASSAGTLVDQSFPHTRAMRGARSTIKAQGREEWGSPPHRVSANENAAPERGRVSRRGCYVRPRRGGARRGRHAGECWRQRASTVRRREEKRAAPRARGRG